MAFTAKQKSAVRGSVVCDRASFKKDGRVEFKRSYFYRMGHSAEEFAENVRANMDAAGFSVSDVVAEDRFARWPKTSYFVATMKVEPKNA
jgi:hypothetical protein